ncbi:extracellular solute-binding protein, partial [Candidatus Giovannonibacteria bacterium]|nr:extracellular solute-binding protein [Candidatus Giovannonibacteria bacterium]
MSNFNFLQIGIIVGAIIFVSVAVLILTGILPGLRTDSNEAANLTFWGFHDEEVYREIFGKYKEDHSKVSIKYEKKNPETLGRDFIDALASGNAPDIVLMPSDLFFKEFGKFSSAPADILTENYLTKNYIPAASIYIDSQKNIAGMPFYADALVLYFNNDLFARKFITVPPKTWDEFLEAAQKITEKDETGRITISGAAMGRSVNIKNSSLILTTLLLQSGDKIISNNGIATLGSSIRSGNVDVRPAESSLRFFSDFANPQKTTESWSSALPEAKELFIGGKLGMYIGLISDYQEIRRKNAHLSFGVSPLPQLKGSARPINGGILYGLVVPKLSKSQMQAWSLIAFLTNPEISALFAERISNVSIVRSALTSYQKDSIKSVLDKITNNK